MNLICNFVIFIICCSILNRARGSALYSQCDSTVITRLVSMCGISLLSAAWILPNFNLSVLVFLISYAGLMLWCTPGWDAYWGAEIGESPHSKMWGCCTMFLRQLLIIPTFVGLAYVTGHPEHYYLSAISMILWLPYFIFGAIDRATAVPFSEYTIGAIIGATTYFIIN